jgi:4-amino-4-deoxychorismate lyase
MSEIQSDEKVRSWVDGVAGNQVPADDRGLQYGDGVFETILVRDRVPRFLGLHLDRLRRGLETLEIDFPAGDALRAEIAHAAAMTPALAVLKIVVTRGSAVRRGYRPAGEERARRIVTLWPTAPIESDLLARGVDVSVARLPLPGFSPFAGIKHLNRLENVLAGLRSGDAQAFESLMLAASGQVISGISSNVFVVKAGEILTPPVDRVGVAGIMRQIVLREAPRLGLAARERSLTLDDVFAADAMFITNARIGVVPVKRVREHAFAMNEITTRLRHAIEALDA